MTKRKKNKHRFKTYYQQKEDDGTGVRIIEDTETGLSYLYVFGPGHGGLTVLLEEEGEPAVVPEI